MGIGDEGASPLLGLQCREKLARRSAEQGGLTFAVGKSQLLARLFQIADPEQELPEVEAHALGARKTGRQRAEPREGEGRLRLREEADRGGDLRLGAFRSEPNGRRELALGGDRPSEPLQRGAVEQLSPNAAGAGARPP